MTTLRQHTLFQIWNFLSPTFSSDWFLEKQLIFLIFGLFYDFGMYFQNIFKTALNLINIDRPLIFHFVCHFSANNFSFSQIVTNGDLLGYLSWNDMCFIKVYSQHQFRDGEVFLSGSDIAISSQGNKTDTNPLLTMQLKFQRLGNVQFPTDPIV